MYNIPIIPPETRAGMQYAKECFDNDIRPMLPRIKRNLELADNTFKNQQPMIEKSIKYARNVIERVNPVFPQFPGNILLYTGVQTVESESRDHHSPLENIPSAPNVKTIPDNMITHPPSVIRIMDDGSFFFGECQLYPLNTESERGRYLELLLLNEGNYASDANIARIMNDDDDPGRPNQVRQDLRKVLKKYNLDIYTQPNCKNGTKLLGITELKQ